MKIKICPKCKGSGKKSFLEDGIFCAFANLLHGKDDCELCNGTGILNVVKKQNYDIYDIEE